VQSERLKAEAQECGLEVLAIDVVGNYKTFGESDLALLARKV